MNDYQRILAAIRNDSRYQNNLDWGKPRKGHPEGTIRQHIRELEENLDNRSEWLTPEQYDRLMVLIHVHDTFKPEAKEGVPIVHDQSHASLARKFLGEFCQDHDLLQMVQFHDEPYGLWRQFAKKGDYSATRFESLLSAIADWELFLNFQLIDNCTAGKSRDPQFWFLNEIADRMEFDTKPFVRWVEGTSQADGKLGR